YLNHGLGFVIVAIGKKLVVVLVGIVETVPASSTRYLDYSRASSSRTSIITSINHTPILFQAFLPQSPSVGFEWGCFSIVCDSTADNSRFLDGYMKTTIDVKTFAACEFDGSHKKTIQTTEQLVSSYAEPTVNQRKNNLKEIVLHDLTTFVASVTSLAAPAVATAFNALPPALGTITPVIRATGFAVNIQ
ncbi:hypothetical protein Tco_0285509, partial [Tanacetum coccineum]